MNEPSRYDRARQAIRNAITLAERNGCTMAVYGEPRGAFLVMNAANPKPRSGWRLLCRVQAREVATPC